MRFAKWLTAWLKIHPKWLSVAGTLVVLLTFTVREAWRDSVKEKISDEQAELSSFEIRDSIAETQCNMLRMTFGPGAAKLPNGPDPSEDAETILRMLRYDEERIALFEEMVHALELDPKINMDLASLRNEHGLATLMLNRGLNAYDRNLATKNGLYRDFAQEGAEHENRLFVLLPAVRQQLSTRSRRQIEAHTQVLLRLTAFSILLYLLGGFIAILGTLADIDVKLE